MRRETAYAQSIGEDLAALGLVGCYDARHIEAYMRLEHSLRAVGVDTLRGDRDREDR